MSLASALVAGVVGMSDVEPARAVPATKFTAPDYAAKPDGRLQEEALILGGVAMTSQTLNTPSVRMRFKK